ncbi:MAG: beta-ketoacyl-ACP synthase III, partial [Actinomycetota bacterium]
MTGATITGIGVSVPETRLDNSELARRLSVSEEWIFDRTGISSRRIAAENDSTSSLALQAARRALTHAGITASDLDMIVVATVTPDYQFPAVASLVQHELGATRAGAFDLAAGCSGWLYALAQSKALVESGAARKVLVCGADVLSRVTDYSDPRSSILFGDGAGAAIVSAVDGPSDFGPFTLSSDGSEPELLCIPPGTPYISMQGREVYKHAVDAISGAVAEALDLAGVTRDERCVLVAHQANARILSAVARRLQWPEHRAVVNIDHYGNTSSASIPIALEEAMRSGQLEPGDLLVVTAFGAGFAWGAGTVRWRLEAPV